MKKIVFLGVREPWAVYVAMAIDIIMKHVTKNDKVFIIEWDAGSKYYSMMEKVSERIKSYISENGIKSRIKLLSMISGNIEKISNPEMYFQNMDELRKFTYKGIDIGLGVSSSLISLTRDHESDLRENKAIIDSLIDTSIHTYNTFKKYLEIIKPELVYIFNGRFAETKAAIRAARELKIPFMTYEIGSTVMNYVLFEDTELQDFDYVQDEVIKLWENGTPDKKMVAEKWYEDRRNGVDSFYKNPKSTLVFTENRERYKIPEMNKEKRNIGIFNSSIDEFASIHDASLPQYLNQTSYISEIVDHFKNDNSIHFYLRIHPNLSKLNNTQTEEIKKLKGENHTNLTIISPEESVDTYALISACDVIITVRSTVSVEAVMLHKPVITLAKSPFDRLNCIYSPLTKEEVCTLLESDLKPKSELGALMYGYRMATYGYPIDTFDFDIQIEGKNTQLVYRNKYFKMDIIEKFSSIVNKEIEVLF